MIGSWHYPMPGSKVCLAKCEQICIYASMICMCVCVSQWVCVHVLVSVLVCVTCLRQIRASISQATRSEVTLKIHLTSKMYFPCTTYMNVVCVYILNGARHSAYYCCLKNCQNSKSARAVKDIKKH